MEAETQTEEEQVNIIGPSDLITPMDIGNFAPGTDSMDSDAEIENYERQLEQTLLQLKIAKSPEADDKMMQNPGIWEFPGS
jgi:hypothetical protein